MWKCAKLRRFFWLIGHLTPLYSFLGFSFNFSDFCSSSVFVMVMFYLSFLLAGVTFVRLWVGKANSDTSLIPLAIHCKSSQVCITETRNDYLLWWWLHLIFLVLAFQFPQLFLHSFSHALWRTRVFVGNFVKIGSNL